ncbi:MAG: hypothetical protein QXT84_04705, partial [Candidatus Bathyarchaeia archaeon]
LKYEDRYIEFSPVILSTGLLNDELKKKLVFGSKLPFLFPSIRLKLIEEVFPSPQERELILSGNAKKIFSIS